MPFEGHRETYRVQLNEDMIDYVKKKKLTKADKLFNCQN